MNKVCAVRLLRSSKVDGLIKDINIRKVLDFNSTGVIIILLVLIS